MIDVLTPPPFTVDVDCNGERHPVEVRDGIPRPRAHDIASERALGAFGGEIPDCIRYCDAVARQSKQLHWLQGMVLQIGEEKARALYLNIRARPQAPSGAHSPWSIYREPSGDLSDVPETFRRLGWLQASRRDVEFKSGAILDPFVKLWVAWGLGRVDGLRRVTINIADEPAVARGDGMRARTVISVRRDWLATVMPFGLEVVRGRFTLGARFEGPNVVLTQLSGSSKGDMRAATRVLPIRGFRLLTGARA